MNKKLLIINKYFLPGVKAGGPIKSISNFVEKYSNSFDIYIVCLNHDAKDKNLYDVETKKIISKNNYKIIYLSDKEVNFSNIIYLLNMIEPHFVYLNSFFDTVFTVKLLIINLVKDLDITLAPRGEFNDGALGLKSNLKKVYIFLVKKFLINQKISFHATNEVEKEKFRELFPGNNIKYLPNLPEKPIKKSILKVNKTLKVISVGRVSKIKNLDIFFRFLNTFKNSNLLWDIYGPIEDFEYYNYLNSFKFDDNIKINFKNVVHNEKIKDIMSGYHFLIHPSFSENYGQVIYEALSIGLPCLISKNTPWNNLSFYNCGYMFDPFSLVDFSEKFSLMVKNVLANHEQMCVGAYSYANDYYISSKNFDNIF